MQFTPDVLSNTRRELARREITRIFARDRLTLSEAGALADGFFNYLSTPKGGTLPGRLYGKIAPEIDAALRERWDVLEVLFGTTGKTALLSQHPVLVLDGLAGTGKSNILGLIAFALYAAKIPFEAYAANEGARAALDKQLDGIGEFATTLTDGNLPDTLPETGCILVDEAALLPFHTLHQLSDWAKAAPSRCIALSCDRRQFAPYPDSVALLASLPAVTLSAIVRQKDPVLRQTVQLAALGLGQNALKALPAKTLAFGLSPVDAAEALRLWLLIDKRIETWQMAPHWQQPGLIRIYSTNAEFVALAAGTLRRVGLPADYAHLLEAGQGSNSDAVFLYLDAEITDRALYVGLTRAKQTLLLVSAAASLEALKIQETFALSS
jgi:hypothetical protein